MDSKFIYTVLVNDVYGDGETLFAERSLSIYDMLVRMRRSVLELNNNNKDIDLSTYTIVVIKQSAWKKHNYGKKLKHREPCVYKYMFPMENDEIEDFINRIVSRKFCTVEIFKKLKSVSDLIPTLNKFLTG